MISDSILSVVEFVDSRISSMSFTHDVSLSFVNKNYIILIYVSQTRHVFSSFRNPPPHKVFRVKGLSLVRGSKAWSIQNMVWMNRKTGFLDFSIHVWPSMVSVIISSTNPSIDFSMASISTMILSDISNGVESGRYYSFWNDLHVSILELSGIPSVFQEELVYQVYFCFDSCSVFWWRWCCEHGSHKYNSACFNRIVMQVDSICECVCTPRYVRSKSVLLIMIVFLEIWSLMTVIIRITLIS